MAEAANILRTFTQYVSNLETESKLLRSLSNLSNTGSNFNPDCEKDSQVIKKLKDLELALTHLEQEVDDFDGFLDNELSSLSALEALSEEVNIQQNEISEMKGSIPNFFNMNDENINAENKAITKKKVKDEIDYVEAVEFSSIPSTTKGRATLQSINEAITCINKIFIQKIFIT